MVCASKCLLQIKFRSVSHSNNVIVYLFTQVRHSQSFSEKLLTPWLLINEDGEVRAAHCTCKAGLGEACSHIGAVLFFVEAVVKKRDGQACTDMENAWLPPQVHALEGKRASEVSFSSSKMKKKMLDGEHPLRKHQPGLKVEPATDEDWSAFLSACHQSGSRPALLCLEEDYAEHFVPLATKFPSAMLTNMHEDEMPNTWSAIMERCFHLAENLSIGKEV